MQPVIEVKNLGATFVRNRRRRLKMRQVFIRRFKRQPSDAYFWPLHGASFEIHPGEAVGVVGSDGTGKSGAQL